MFYFFWTFRKGKRNLGTQNGILSYYNFVIFNLGSEKLTETVKINRILNKMKLSNFIKFASWERKNIGVKMWKTNSRGNI